jgi:hypothetical protein
MGLCITFGLLYGSSNNKETSVAMARNSIPLVKDTSNLILQILNTNPGFFKNYIDSSKEFEIQIIYTQIDRDKKNKPSFKEYTYHLNDNEYFCAASTSKLPVTMLTLEKLKRLSKLGIDKYTRMRFDSAFTCEKPEVKDTIAPDSLVCVANYIKKIMLVSDNNSYNRLFEFLGQRQINERLWQMGFKKAMIIQRFNDCDANSNRFTNPMSFLDASGKVVYSQPLVENKDTFKNPLGAIMKGKGYIDDSDKLVLQPRDFTFYNNLPLQDIHDMMLRIYFPKSFPKRQRFKIVDNDYPFLYKYMSMYPRESEFPKYHNIENFRDNRKKYLYYGTDSFANITDTTIRIFNIVGQLSGYLSDCAYIVDFKNNVEFMLAAVIYNNQCGIFDVANFRYHTLGFPFLQELGRAVYQYDLKRPRKYEPDLSNLKNIVESKKIR